MQKKLTRLLTALAVLLVMLAALWYARPVDVYTLGHLGEVKRISFSPEYFDEQEDLHTLGALNLDASDPRFAPILEQAEALRFQRSPLDLVTRHFRVVGTITGSPVQTDTYAFSLILNDGETYVHLSFTDQWFYNIPGSKRTLPVQMKDAAAVGSDLGRFLWDIAQKVPS